MFFDFLNGFLIECALIMAVGLQNAFILRQGIRREYTAAAVLACTFCECALVSVGIAGMGAILTSRPTLINIITLLGICFLIFYALKSIYTAFKSNEALDFRSADAKSKTARQVIISAVAFSWLNPHVILDTTLMGAFSTKYYPHQWIFGMGVFSAAFLWFCFLGILGRALAKPLNSPKTWRVINLCIALLCAYMAYSFIADFNEPHDEHHGMEMLEMHGH